jgi:hypothetical protein
MMARERSNSLGLLFLAAIVGAMFVFVPEQQPTARQDFNQLPKTENQW